MKRLLAFLFLLIPSFSLAQVQSKAKLPDPTGTFGIGRTAFHWTDNSRQETATSEVRDYRELLVYPFNPIDKNSRSQQAVYFPNFKKIEAFEERFGKTSFVNSMANLINCSRMCVPTRLRMQNYPL